MKFSFLHGNKEILLDLRQEKGLMRGIGLIFKTKNTENLLFEFRKPSKVAITSLFVFFPFLAVWLNEKKEVIEVRKITPFKLSITPKHDSKYLIEIPLNSSNLKLVESLYSAVAD
ncbi:MAG TPA: hypothetical protein VHA12_03505 [Candidatus Nanoarchaeia archaeon]|nr:hypothetical protein [Candidatus Nanoarchaeia archaeon]